MVETTPKDKFVTVDRKEFGFEFLQQMTEIMKGMTQLMKDYARLNGIVAKHMYINNTKVKKE